jgi:hypothetical protein
VPRHLLDGPFCLPPISLTPHQSDDTPYNLTPLNENYRPPFFSGGSGLYATAGDFLRLLQMLLNGGELDGVRVLSEGAVESMMRNQVPASVLPLHFNNWQGAAFGCVAFLRVCACARVFEYIYICRSVDGGYINITNTPPTCLSPTLHNRLGVQVTAETEAGPNRPVCRPVDLLIYRGVQTYM